MTASNLLVTLLNPPTVVQLQSRAPLDDRAIQITGSRLRSLSDILRVCIAMIFFCAWVSVHRNIPPYRENIGRAILGRFKMLFWVVVVPELVLAWAAKQWVAAREVAKVYNGQSPAPEIKWTTTHGHFLVMGGFQILVPSDSMPQGQPRILSFELFQKLVRKGLLPDVITEITEEEIKDRSKGDGLTKAIAICQTLWFIVQCIARHEQNLAMSEFELVTLALSGVSGIMYIFWWNKPKEARVPMKVDLISDKQLPLEGTDETNLTQPGDATRNEDSGNDHNASNPEIIEMPRQLEATTGPPSSDSVFACILECDNEKQVSESNSVFTFSAKEVKRTSRKFIGVLTRIVMDEIWDSKQSGVSARIFQLSHGIYLLPAYIVFLFFFLPIFLVLFIFASIRDIISTFNISPTATSVPIFYAPRTENELGIEFIISAIIGFVYGGLHCLAWDFVFPTDIDRIFWRTASVCITVLPLLAILMGSIRNVSKQEESLTDVEKDIMGVINLITTITLVVLFFLHVSARLMLFGHACWLLRQQPESVYFTVNWSRFLPHFS